MRSMPAGFTAERLEIAGARVGVNGDVVHGQRVEVAAHRGERRAQFV